MSKSQNQNVFSIFFHSREMRLLAFWAFLQTEMTDFPTFSRLSAYMYTWYPFRAGPLI